jgi:hypothetical protein
LGVASGNKIIIIHLLKENEMFSNFRTNMKEMDHKIIHIHWIEEDLLLILNVNLVVFLFNSNLVNLFEFNLTDILVFNQKVSFGIFSTFQSLFLLQEGSLIQFSLKDWKQRIEYLISKNEWSNAIQTVIDVSISEKDQLLIRENLCRLFDGFLFHQNNFLDCLRLSLSTKDSVVVHHVVKTLIKEDNFKIDELITFIENAEDLSSLQYFSSDFDIVIKFLIHILVVGSLYIISILWCHDENFLPRRKRIFGTIQILPFEFRTARSSRCIFHTL